MTDLNLKRRAAHCVTHHYACDCREYEMQKRLQKAERERDAARAEVERCRNLLRRITSLLETWPASDTVLYVPALVSVLGEARETLGGEE